MSERNEQEISQIIEENLEGVLSGKTSMEEIIRRYPQHAAVLRRDLEAASWLHSHQEQIKPRAGFIAASRTRVVSRISQEAHSRGGKHSVLSFIWPRRRVFQWAAGLIVLALLLSGASGLVSYAQNSIPGQQLYGVKRTNEAIAIGLTVNEVKKVELNIQITDQRFNEVEALVETGEIAYVAPTLKEFNQGVENSVALLKDADNTLPPGEKKLLAQELTTNLVRKAERLENLVDKVPGEVRVEMVNSQELTLSSAFSAMMMMDEMDGRLGTPTPTGTATSTQSMTPTATATATFAPSKTPTPTQLYDESEIEPTFTPLKDGKKATHTPRPTNDNRPTKQPPKEKKEDPPKKPDDKKNK